jgi:hypothetical protein
LTGLNEETKIIAVIFFSHPVNPVNPVNISFFLPASILSGVS